MMLSLIPAKDVETMWPLVGDGVERMIEKSLGTYTPAGIKQMAIEGEVFLFCVAQDGQPISTIICSIGEGRRKVFEVAMAWGEGMESWLDIVDDGLTRVARELGCDAIAITGRKGWVKVLKDRGFTEKVTTVVREL